MPQTRGMQSWVLGALAFLAMVLPASSLFEDQIGVNDFALKNLGKVSQAVFHPDAQRRQVFVVTEVGALAALDVKSGAMLWRQMLSERADVIRLFGNQLATLSAGQGHLSVWDAQSGLLLWDRMVLDSASGEKLDAAGLDASFLLDQDGDNIDDVAVVCNNQLALFSGDDGSELWRLKDIAKAGINLSTVHSDGQGVLSVVGASSSGSSAQISRISSKDGAVLKSGLVNKPSGASRAFCESHVLLSGGCMACFGGHVLTLADVATGTASMFDTFPWSGLANKPPGIYMVQSASKSSVSIVFPAAGAGGEAKAVVAEVKKSGESWTAHDRHVVDFGHGHALASGLDKNGQEVWLHMRTVETNTNPIAGDPEAELHVDALSTSMGAAKVHHQVSGYSRKANGEVDKVFSNPYVRKDGTIGYRALVVSETHTACLLQQDAVQWEEHGALAETVAASFVDIPVLPPLHDEMFQSGRNNPISALLTRFVADITDLALLPVTITQMLKSNSKVNRRMPWDTEGVSLKHDMEGDRFGFKKLAVLVTKPGIVFGIHSQTGAIVWRTRLSDLLSPKVEAMQLFMTRPTSSPGQHGDLEIIVVGRNAETGKGMNFWLNPLTGFCTGRHDMDKKIVHATLLPLMAPDHTKVLMQVMDDMEVRIVPDLVEVQNLFAKNLKSIFFYLTSENSLDGYAIAARMRKPMEVIDETTGETIEWNTAPGSQQFANLQAAGANWEFKGQQTWTVAFPEGEEIVGMAPHSAEESVKAAGKVLGNRGVLLKYLNVNLLALATETRGSARRSDTSVHIYLIDTVLGAIVHSAVHKDSAGPVQMVQSENIVLYSFWHTRKQHTELAVMELYENKHQEITGAAQIMKYNETKQSSVNMEKPWVLGQAYILSTGVKMMAVTNTMHGITTRNFLLGLATDQVFSLDKRFVDPRRPAGKPTAEDVEEGLMQYSPFVPLAPTSMLSYNQTIFNLRGISVSPARIESTCHMLAFGTDIFYSRVMPSKAYDCLGEDFNYATLILSVLALSVATQVASYFMQKRELAQAWK